MIPNVTDDELVEKALCQLAESYREVATLSAERSLSEIADAMNALAKRCDDARGTYEQVMSHVDAIRTDLSKGQDIQWRFEELREIGERRRKR